MATSWRQLEENHPLTTKEENTMRKHNQNPTIARFIGKCISFFGRLYYRKQIETKTRNWVIAGLLGSISFCYVDSTLAAAEPYIYPASMPQKTIKPEFPVGTLHDSGVSIDLPGKYLKNPPASPTRLLEWHFRGKDGRDITKKSISMVYSSKENSHGYENVGMGIQFPFQDAVVGDVFLFYILYNDPNNMWVSKEFAVRCGGSKTHKDCNQCFKPIPLAMAQEELKRGARSQVGTVAEIAGKADSGQQTTPSGNPLMASEIENIDVTLTQEIEVYSLESVPSEQLIGHLKAGVTVHVLEKLTPTLAHVRFSTSSGKTYEAAMKILDLQNKAHP